MIKVRFFALLRERLGTSDLELAIDHIETVSDAIQTLKQRSERWQVVFEDQEVIAAVNQQLVDKAHPLQADDELALFPPVTGG
ncbi:molybdopterin converting factor subunit 1 [Aliidiomarina indica]|uniref:molybdopterin converting factor subunit 1 n=1 Tax=Aliidiomarina indica TaxID=2749147 RepID=UPI00188F9DB4|nr:molybdopterin converting factor subunit 1 [Aliidiomarina indica]